MYFVVAFHDFFVSHLNYLAVLLSRPFLNGHARLNGRLGEIARFFVILPVFFEILVILNGVCYAQIKQ